MATKNNDTRIADAIASINENMATLGNAFDTMTKEYRAVSKHPDSTLGTGSTFRTRWYPTRDEALANRDPRAIETYSRLIGVEHRYVTQPEAE